MNVAYDPKKGCYESTLDSLALFFVSPGLQFARPGQKSQPLS
jgi:hypothetical protein